MKSNIELLEECTEKLQEEIQKQPKIEELLEWIHPFAEKVVDGLLGKLLK